ncbi:hypothetical protein ACVH8U_000151 [Yersinia enterocolitica]|nr:hypothetical protein [Yersinia enterocolitica]
MLRRKSHIPLLIGFILIVMIALPLIVMLFYGYYITGGEYLISKRSSDWADFGTLLSGVFTLSGALATLSTLIFLILESKHNNAERTEQVEREKEIASINKDKIIFEKYKLHREMFDDILNKIESKFNNKLSITSRTSLYRNIFADNTFNHCVTKVDLNKDAKANDLIDMCALAKRIASGFKNDGYYNNPRQFVYDVMSISNMIELRYNRNATHGDIVFDNAIVLNVYEPVSIITTFTHILNELIFFSQNDKVIDIAYLVSESNLSIAMYSAGIGFNKIKARDKTFSLSFINGDKNITKAVELASGIESLPPEIKPYFNSSIRFIQYFFSLKQDVTNLSSDSCYLDFLLKYTLNLEEDLKYAQEKNLPADVINSIITRKTIVEMEMVNL